MDRQAAFDSALAFLGDDATHLWVERERRIIATDSETAIRRVAVALERELDDFEREYVLSRNRDHWLFQFVFVATEDGDTPQGPAVSVFDDGEITAFRPM